MIMSFKMALRSISSNKLRAVLTMLGIIIGVMALVVLVSLVDGATNSVTDRVSELGADLVTVNIIDDKGTAVTENDLFEWTQEAKSVRIMAPYRMTSATIKYADESDTVSVYGTTSAYYDIQGLSMYQGRFIKNADIDNYSRVCVINETTAEEMIGYTDCVGEEISLNGMKYKVVGVLEDDDNSLTAVFSSGTMVAYIPYTALARLSANVTTDVTVFCAAAAEESSVDEMEDEIEKILMKRFENDDDAFRISSLSALEDTISSVTSILSVLLGSIAAISLIVGGIGIMNIMLVTVTERTREIGIRKAIGATRSDILRQFLMEAVVLCMMGCAIGIFLSWSILRLAAIIVASLGITFGLSGSVVIASVLFCFIIGVVFGLYPANKAAKMKPIDALHYGG